MPTHDERQTGLTRLAHCVEMLRDSIPKDFAWDYFYTDYEPADGGPRRGCTLGLLNHTSLEFQAALHGKHPCEADREICQFFHIDEPTLWKLFYQGDPHRVTPVFAAARIERYITTAWDELP